MPRISLRCLRKKYSSHHCLEFVVGRDRGVRVAGRLHRGMEGARVGIVLGAAAVEHRREVGAAAEPGLAGDDEARVHVHRRHVRVVQDARSARCRRPRSADRRRRRGCPCGIRARTRRARSSNARRPSRTRGRCIIAITPPPPGRAGVVGALQGVRTKRPGGGRPAARRPAARPRSPRRPRRCRRAGVRTRRARALAGFQRRGIGGGSRRGALRPASIGVHLLLEPDLDQRLIGHVALVGGDLDAIEQVLRQPQRDRRGRQLEIGKARALRLAPIDIVGGVVGLPKFPLLPLRCAKSRDRLKFLVIDRALSFRFMSRAEMIRISVLPLARSVKVDMQPPSFRRFAERLKSLLRAAVFNDHPPIDGSPANTCSASACVRRACRGFAALPSSQSKPSMRRSRSSCILW